MFRCATALLMVGLVACASHGSDLSVGSSAGQESAGESPRVTLVCLDGVDGEAASAHGLVHVEVLAEADGSVAEDASIQMRAVDPDRPWLQYAVPIAEEGQPRFTRSGRATYWVPAGTLIACCAYSPERGVVEGAVRVQEARAARVVLALPKVTGTGRVVLGVAGRGEEGMFAMPDRVMGRVLSPVYGFTLASRELVSERWPLDEVVPAGRYRVRADRYMTYMCANGPPIPDAIVQFEKAVVVGEGETYREDATFPRGRVVMIDAFTHGAEGLTPMPAVDVMQLDDDAWSPAPSTLVDGTAAPQLARLTRHVDDGAFAYDETLLVLRPGPTISSIYEVFALSGPAFLKSRFQAGRHTLTVDGPGVVKTTRTFEVRPHDGIGYGTETFEFPVERKPIAPIGARATR